MNKIKLFLVLLFLLGILQITYSQSTIKWEIDKRAGKKIKEKVPDGKALLVFDSPVDLEFESSVENIKHTQKKDGKYYLFVSKGPQAITIKYLGNYNINFGQLMDPNSLPALKNKEIIFFRISVIHELEYYDITEKEKAKGNVGIPVGVNVSDALIVFNIFPPDLEIEITDENNVITKQSKEKGTYKVFITAPGNRVIKINQTNQDITTIEINTLETKETRFYLIRKPVTLEDYEENDAPINEIDIGKQLIGYWGGNLGSKKIFVDIQNINSGTLSGRLYTEGVFHKITGVVKAKSSSVFYVTINKPQTELSRKKGTLDFLIKMGVGSGIWISEYGGVSDFNIMKVNELPKENTNEDISRLKLLKSKLEGIWVSKSDDLIREILISNVGINNSISGHLSTKDNKVCKFGGTINEKNGKINLVINIDNDWAKIAGVIILSVVQNTASGFFTSNDSMTMVNLNFNKISK